jgi:outer membrane receptor protein involved in Fe transport
MIAGWLAALLCPGAVAAEEGRTGPPDFSGLTLEQLLNVDVVYAASRRGQPSREAPSAITLVTSDEIRRQGYRTLGDLLRAVPSFYVTYDRNYSYVGVRGFGRPGDYNTRILLLVNGLRANDNVYDMAYIGHEFAIDVDLIERVEVVRGPSGALYGNSAFFAVVNVVTRQGRHLAGGELVADAGTFATLRTRASYGREVGPGLSFVASATLAGSQGPRLYFPELDRPDTNHGVADGLDGERYQNAFLSVAFQELTLQATHVDREKEIPTASYGTVFGDPRSRTGDRSTQVSLAWERVLRSASLAGRLHYGRFDYEGRYPFEGSPPVVYQDYGRGRWWGSEWTLNTPVGARHLLTVGAEFQENLQQDQGGYDVDPFLRHVDVRSSSRRWGVFAQDHVRLAVALSAYVGVRHDAYDTFGHETSPRLGLLYAPDKRTQVKLLYGSAFRAPNEYELHYYAGTDPDLRPETIRTLEGVLERTLTPNARFVASVFQNRVDDLITLRTAETEELSFSNVGRINSHGMELALDGRRAAGQRARLSYSWQRTREAGQSADLGNSPRHLAKLQLEAPLGRAWAGLDVQAVSARTTLRGNRVGGFATANFTLTMPVFRRLGLSASLYNAFDARYANPGSEEHLQDALAQDGRQLRVKLTWRF